MLLRKYTPFYFEKMEKRRKSINVNHSDRLHVYPSDLCKFKTMFLQTI